MNPARVTASRKNRVVKESSDMIKKALLGSFVLIFLANCQLLAQTNTFCQSNVQGVVLPTVHAGKLVCLLPNLGFPPINSGPDPIGGLDAAIASQASLFPLASPASGIIYSNDPALRIPIASGTDSFGPIMFERAETLHRGKFFVALTYQNFQFSNLDGINLKSTPAYFLISNTGPTYDQTYSRIDLKINQFAIYATYGLTNRIDISVAIPVRDVKLSSVSNCTTQFEVGVGSVSPCEFRLANGHSQSEVMKSEEASGIGDLVLRGKTRLWQGERLRFAAAVDVRVKTGDELNFLGTGAVGVRPFVAASLRGRIAPHADLGYQWNGHSDIASIQGPGITGKLPNNLFYVGGADARVIKRLTLSADYMGQRVDNALREGIHTESQSGFTGIYTGTGSYNTNYVTVGGKFNPTRSLLVTANVFFKMDDNGLHNRAAPLVGLSYTF